MGSPRKGGWQLFPINATPGSTTTLWFIVSTIIVLMHVEFLFHMGRNTTFSKVLFLVNWLILASPINSCFNICLLTRTMVPIDGDHDWTWRDVSDVGSPRSGASLKPLCESKTVFFKRGRGCRNLCRVRARSSIEPTSNFVERPFRFRSELLTGELVNWHRQLVKKIMISRQEKALGSLSRKVHDSGLTVCDSISMQYVVRNEIAL